MRLLGIGKHIADGQNNKYQEDMDVAILRYSMPRIICWKTSRHSASEKTFSYFSVNDTGIKTPFSQNSNTNTKRENEIMKQKGYGVNMEIN